MCRIIPQAMPAQRQPLVLTHPVTGRRSLYGFNEGTENALLSFQPLFLFYYFQPCFIILLFIISNPILSFYYLLFPTLFLCVSPEPVLAK